MESTDSTSEDGLIGNLITVARKRAENVTKRSLVSQTWKLVIDDFPNSTAEIELPRAPLSTVSSAVTITFIEDTTGSSTTVGSTVFTIDTDSTPGRIYPAYDNEWPSNVRSQRNAVSIQYITGYSTSTIPTPIVNWIKMFAADLYENRQGLTAEQIRRIPRDYVNGPLDEYIIP